MTTTATSWLDGVQRPHRKLTRVSVRSKDDTKPLMMVSNVGLTRIEPDAAGDQSSPPPPLPVTGRTAAVPSEQPDSLGETPHSRRKCRSMASSMNTRLEAPRYILGEEDEVM